MICPNCEKEIEPNQPQCPHCGCHFQVTYVPKSAPKPEPAIEKQPEKAEDLKEKATKTEAPEFHDEKATLIEAPETAAEQVCPECGKPVPLTARFCKWCGSPLSKEQDAQQTDLDDKPIQDKLSEDDLQQTESPEENGAQIEKAEDLKEKATKTEAPEFPDEKATLIEAPETAVEQVCPECGKPVPLTARFCKWCGSPLSKEQDNQQPVLNQTTNAEKNMPSTKICGNCGRTIKATASFCKWCGNPCNDKNKEEE